MFQKGETNGQILLRGVGCRKMQFEQKTWSGSKLLALWKRIDKMCRWYVGEAKGMRNEAEH